MHVSEWLVTLPCMPAFFAAVERNLPISFFPVHFACTTLHHLVSFGVSQRGKKVNQADSSLRGDDGQILCRF